MTLKRLGTMIREHRDRQDLTQVALAKRAKISQSYLAQLELGQRKAPSIATVQRLAKALRVPIADLLA